MRIGFMRNEKNKKIKKINMRKGPFIEYPIYSLCYFYMMTAITHWLVMHLQGCVSDLPNKRTDT